MNVWLLGTLLVNFLLFSLLIHLHSGAERSNTVRAPEDGPQGHGGAASPGSVRRLGKGVRGGFAENVRLRWARDRAAIPYEEHNSLRQSPASHRNTWAPEGVHSARQPDFLPGGPGRKSGCLAGPWRRAQGRRSYRFLLQQADALALPCAFLRGGTASQSIAVFCSSR